MSRRRAFWLLAAALSWSITLTNQVWVGGLTIYADDRVAQRAQLHQSILTNRLPDGVESWSSLGANGLNLRILTVWTAEGIHRVIGLSLERTYWIIETGALFLCCLLLFGLLELIAGPYFALGGLLYFGSVLPLTYLFHYFHPWDRPCLAAWLAALICTQRRQWLYLAAVLAVGMLIKYDILVFPLLVLFAEHRRRGWVKSGLLAGGLLALTTSIYIALRWTLPGGFEPRPVLAQLVENLERWRDYPIQFPPLLALAVPAILAIAGYSKADSFARAGVQLALVVTAILFLQVNFVEFRTEVPLLPLLLPAAIYGVRRISGLGPPAAASHLMPDECVP